MTDARVGVPGGDTTFGAPTARAETLADRRLFLTEGLVPLACRTCGTEVLVRKNSPKHTSVQWMSNPAQSCPVFAGRRAGGTPAALVDACEYLTESIAHATKTGLIPQRQRGACDDDTTPPSGQKEDS